MTFEKQERLSLIYESDPVREALESKLTLIEEIYNNSIEIPEAVFTAGEFLLGKINRSSNLPLCFKQPTLELFEIIWETECLNTDDVLSIENNPILERLQWIAAVNPLDENGEYLEYAKRKGYKVEERIKGQKLLARLPDTADSLYLPFKVARLQDTLETLGEYTPPVVETPEIEIKRERPAQPVKELPNFGENWNNLSRRFEAMSNGKVSEKVRKETPLDESFRKWANTNYDLVKANLDRGENFKVLRQSFKSFLNPDVETGAGQPTGDYIPPPVTPAMLRRIDEKIASYNPKVRTLEQANEPTDEFGNPADEEYVEKPEIIGDPENPHFIGVDENDDEVYQDFDHEGHFLPMGNPQNSTDYQDDFNPTDYSGEAWNSVDNIDDHHLDEYHYREVGITEAPQFDYEGKVEWRSEAHREEQDALEPRKAHLSEDSFLQDALAWISKESYLDEASKDDVSWNIEETLSVNPEFLEHLETIGVDWERFQERIQEELDKLAVKNHINNIEMKIQKRVLNRPAHLDKVEAKISQRAEELPTHNEPPLSMIEEPPIDETLNLTEGINWHEVQISWDDFEKIYPELYEPNGTETDKAIERMKTSAHRSQHARMGALCEERTDVRSKLLSLV